MGRQTTLHCRQTVDSRGPESRLDDEKNVRMRSLMQALHRQSTRFLGYGDPKHAKVWFIGLEDSQPLRSQAELDRNPVRSYVTTNGYEGKSTAVYTIISKVIMRLRGEATVAAWRAYRANKLFSVGSEAFLSNLYPLGKRVEEEWPEKYQRWLGMTRREYYGCLQHEDIPRFSYLRAQRRRYNAPLTICFGKGHWRHFARCFAVENEQFQDADQFRLYPTARLVMTEFFRSTRMPDKSIRRLVSLINNAGLNPFRQ